VIPGGQKDFLPITLGLGLQKGDFRGKEIFHDLPFFG
jgi:hypothetical protein